jgi:hypothetical protein
MPRQGTLKTINSKMTNPIKMQAKDINNQLTKEDIKIKIRTFFGSTRV